MVTVTKNIRRFFVGFMLGVGLLVSSGILVGAHPDTDHPSILEPWVIHEMCAKNWTDCTSTP